MIHKSGDPLEGIESIREYDVLYLHRVAIDNSM